MRIDQLKLHNFRGFENFELDLDPQLTVLAGVNGAGKTSVLEGLAVAAGAWFLGFDSIAPRNIKREDVRVWLQSVMALATSEPQYPASVSARGDIDGALEWTRELRTKGGKTTHSDATAIRDRARVAQAAVREGKPVDLPIVAYYGAGRLWKQHNDSPKKARGLVSRTQGYVDCLEPTSNHKLFESWMRQMELVSLQRMTRRYQETGTAFMRSGDLVNPIDPAVRALVEGVNTLSYDMSQETLTLLMKDGTDRRFDMLSDGYRNLVAMAADLAWRAAQLNPHLGAEAPRETKGIVLIDEIELHLHPKWQREVLSRLMTAFPKVQFVVTTHSPVVLGSVEASKIRLLDGTGGVQRVDVAGGLTANHILNHMMGVPERDDATLQRLARLGVLLEAGKTDEARTLFDALRVQLGNHDNDLQTLEWELRDLEVPHEEPGDALD